MPGTFLLAAGSLPTVPNVPAGLPQYDGLAEDGLAHHADLTDGDRREVDCGRLRYRGEAGGANDSAGVSATRLDPAAGGRLAAQGSIRANMPGHEPDLARVTEQPESRISCPNGSLSFDGRAPT